MMIIIGLLVAGIAISGFMAVRTGQEERRTEEEWIEQEGLKYISRMEEEKERRLDSGTNEAS